MIDTHSTLLETLVQPPVKVSCPKQIHIHLMAAPTTGPITFLINAQRITASL
jgi:hypothetical protein